MSATMGVDLIISIVCPGCHITQREGHADVGNVWAEVLKLLVRCFVSTAVGYSA
jgi:hypothetical protein